MRQRAATVTISGVAITLAVIDFVGRAEYVAGLLPAAITRYLPVVYLAGFALALALLRTQSPRPRLILGLNQIKLVQAKYDPQCHPLTVLNDGSETALNIRVLDAEAPGGTATFGTHGTHVAAGESVALNIFCGSKRLDRTLWESLTHLLGVSEKGDGNRVGLWRLPVRMLYDDHQGRSHRDRFDIVLEVIPRDDGNFQLCDLRVEKAAKF